MRCLLRVPSHLLLILSVSLSCRAQDNSCTSSHNVEELQQLRLEHLKTNILAQLGFTEPPELPPEDEPTPGPTPDDIADSYNKLETYTDADSKCTSGDFFAKPVKSFVGVLSPAEGLVSRYKRTVRSAEFGSQEEQEVVVEAGILNQYTISVEFNLPEDMNQISRAKLMLYQDEANTLVNPVLDRYQLVQIRTIINNVRYFVEKKSVDVYGFGLLSFDVTRAAELWVQEGVHGNILLEVLVTCYSSPNCSRTSSDGQIPARVSFIQSDDDSRKMPRIITVFKNPLEQDLHNEPHRHKRSDTVPELEFCAANQSTCCLQPLTINFKQDLGFNFISKPEYFNANFCDGYCPEVSGIGLGNTQRFQILQYWSASPTTSSIEPCCTGLEYKPLQILVSVYDQQSARWVQRLDRLDQVIVTKCRCG